MVPRSRQSGFDLRALTKMIGDANDDEPGPMLPWSLMDDLARLIPAEEVSICDLDVANRKRVMQQDVREDGPRILATGDPSSGPVDMDVFWRHYPSFWSGYLPSRAGQVRRWADRYPGQMLMQKTLYRDFHRLLGRRYFLSVGLQATAGHERNLMFWRHSGPDFSDRDKDLLTLLRPHLAEIYAGADRRRHGNLTPREWQVLELVAQGLSNAEIACVLVASVSTVRKHMEHIFDRTGARSRGAAVAKMLPELRPVTGAAGVRRPL